MSKPTIYFEPWNVTPCLPDGRLINQDTIGRWDGVTHKFLKDWECNLIISDDVAYIITIRKGFISDGGSIPKVFRNVINPWGYYAPAFFIHDALYASEYFPRCKSDWLLLCSCEALKANWYRRNQIYIAVRSCGWMAWEEHSLDTVESNKKLINLQVL